MRFNSVPLDISDFPTRHSYGLALRQNHIARILAGWVGELAVPIYLGRDVTGFARDDTGVDVELSDGESLRAGYLVGCDGGRSLLHDARPVLLNLDEPGGVDITPWADRVHLIEARYLGTRELPAIGASRLRARS